MVSTVESMLLPKEGWQNENFPKRDSSPLYNVVDNNNIKTNLMVGYDESYVVENGSDKRETERDKKKEDNRIILNTSGRNDKSSRLKRPCKIGAHFKQARIEFSSAISKDDIIMFQNVAKKYKDVMTIESKELEEVVVSDNEGCSKKSLLYEALEKDKRKIVSHMVSTCTISYFLNGHDDNITKESKKKMMAFLSKKRKTYLHLLVEKGNKEAMNRLVGRLKEACVNFDEHHNPSWPRIPYTFGFGRTQRDLEIFLNAKAPFETKDRRKRLGTAVHLAVGAGKWEMLDSLASYGLCLDDKDSEQETPLMLAIQQNQLKAMKELIRLGVDLDIQNSKDTAALHMAISEGRDKMVKILVDEDCIDLNVERIKNPRWVIEMASKANNAKVVGWLLDRNNSKGPIFKTNVHQALLIASSNGFAEVISVILERLPRLLNKSDDFGNTPLMLATDSGKLEAVKLLVEMPGIDLEKRNNLGQSVFDLAMKLEDESVLIFLLGRVKFNDALDSFYVHTAVSNGKVDRLKLILSNDHKHEKLHLLEEHTENSVYHTAAAFNSSQVIDLFLDENDDIKDLQNKNLETALHVSVRRNNKEAVQSLLNKKVRLDIQDSEGQNVLHAAVTNRSTGMDIFQMLLEAFNKVDSSLINEQESNGNTVLHLSAMFNKPEILKKLNMCDPEIENKDGETGLHLAARLGSAETVRILLEMFYTERKANIDRRDELGFSALYRSAEEGDREKYELMLSYGADMGLTSETGPSIIHRLVECCKADPNRAEKYTNVYRATVKWSVVWYCRKKGLRCPLPNTNQYYLMQLHAVKLLTNETYYENCNVLQYASKKGENKMLKVILNTPNVYKFDKNCQLKLERVVESVGGAIKNSATSLNSELKVDSHKTQTEKNNGELAKFLEEKSLLPTNSLLYDVTFLIPGHFPEADEDGLASEATEIGLKERRKSQVFTRSNSSCLEYLVNSGEEINVNEILGVEPFQSLVYTYWTLCRRVYELLMWTHVIYMVFLTYFVTPDTNWIRNRFHHDDLEYDNSTNRGLNIPRERNWLSVKMFSLFLIWPSMILLYEIILACHFIISLRKSTSNQTSLRYELLGKLKVSEITSGLMRIPVGLMLFVFDNLSHISSISFATSCVVWYVACVYSIRLQMYLECLAIFLISGWLHTINYVKGFKDWNALANILKTILIKDLTRFIYIYIFVLISFGYAIHVLIQINTTSKPQLSSSTSTIYLTFYQMLSPGNVLDITETPMYWEKGTHKGASMLRAVYATYSILSSVVLMNMLIAMMNSTYSDVKSVRLTSWRFESLRMAVWAEKNFLLVGKLKLIRFKAKFDRWQNRWFMKKISEKSGQANTSLEIDITTSVRNMENEKTEKIKNPETNLPDDLSRKFDMMKSEIETVNETLSAYESRSLRLFNSLNLELKRVHELCLETYHLSRVNNKLKK